MKLILLAIWLRLFELKGTKNKKKNQAQIDRFPTSLCITLTSESLVNVMSLFLFPFVFKAISFTPL